ncbi:lectin-like protein [Balneola sp. MJW-20]|uniref:lectin-like protein n=1 Tax=Gracilimonas aurantiaca TaxID=3234185 RepID=UPI003466D9A8
MRGKFGKNVVLNEGNGHYYEAVAAENLSWFDAWRAAANTNSGVCVSHLATITSQEENDFIISNFPEAAENGYWLGGNQLNGGAEPDGGWIWITGETWDYTNWANGEPNDLFGEDALHFFPAAFGAAYTPGVWNDQNEFTPSDAILGYVVEYECPAGKVVDRVTGSGHFNLGPEGEEALRTFSFTAHKYENGVVAGEYQLKSRSGEVKEHGDVTCLSVSEDGTRAWIGGIIERNDPNASIEGSEIVFIVEDNGQGMADSPDKLSLRATFEPGGAAIICNDQLNFVPLNEIEKGNISIH